MMRIIRSTVLGATLACLSLGCGGCGTGAIEEQTIEGPAAAAPPSAAPVSETQASLIGLDRSAWPHITVGPALALQEYYPTYFGDLWAAPAYEPVMVDGTWHQVPATQPGDQPTWVYQEVPTTDQLVFALWGARAQDWSCANASDLGLQSADFFYDLGALPYRLIAQPPMLRGRREPGGTVQPTSQAGCLDIFIQDDPVGCRVLSVGTDGPAARAGVRSDDVIVAIDRQHVESAEWLADIISRYRPGDVVTLRVWRDARVLTLRAVIGRTAPPPSKPGALGVTIQQDLAGALVLSVPPDSPGAKAGLQRGDVITGIDHQVVTTAQLLAGIIAKHQPGDVVTLKVSRDSKAMTIRATLGPD
jgi:hypothetical protein